MKFICYNNEIRTFNEVTLILLNETTITISFIDKDMWVIRDDDKLILTRLFNVIHCFLNKLEKHCLNIEWEHAGLSFSE